MTLILTHRVGPVLEITLNRPDRLNAVTPELFAALSNAVVEAESDDIRAVVLTGSGKGFCVGGDLKAEAPKVQPPARRMRTVYQPVLSQLAALAKPVVAAVNGPAIGAGLSLAAAADLRIASDRARFMAGFARIGLSPDTGASYYLPRLIGYSRAFELLATGREIDLDTALCWGLVNEVVKHEILLDRAREVAVGLAEVPGSAIPETKRLLQHASLVQLSEQLEREAQAYERTSLDEGRQAAREALRRKLS